MQGEFEYPMRTPMIQLLNLGLAEFAEELRQRMEASGFGDIRPGHGCVFGGIDPERGSRLTELADRAAMTKQSVGEMASDLEHRGYLERVADPSDGRAKIIRLSERGHQAYAAGRKLIDQLDREWAERYGEERVTALRDALEAITAERLGALPA